MQMMKRAGSVMRNRMRPGLGRKSKRFSKLSDATKQIDIDDYSFDLCLMATALHDFEEAGHTDVVSRQAKTLLKPKGTLVIVEFKKIEGPPGPPINIRLSEEEVDKMVTGCKS